MPQNISKIKKFNKIIKDIKEVKIQGARNIAKKALYAYSLIPTKRSKKILMSARPTEPMLENVLNKMQNQKYQEIMKHFDYAQDNINKSIVKLIKNGDTVFTHCHSTNVINALKYAKRKGKKFEVYNTETRPLMQGRKTANELKNAGIKVTLFIDSAAMIAIKKSTKIFFGADALLKNGIINKIGSGMFSKIAKESKVQVYIIADSWKYSSKNIPIENRKLNEVWDKAPKDIKIKNPAFEFVQKKYITKIISEFGILEYNDFIKKAGNS